MGDVVGLPDAPHRGLLGDSLDELVEGNPDALGRGGRHGRLDETGTNDVGRNPELAQLERERLREPLDPGLGRRVVRLAAVAEGRHGRDEHHRPALLLDHRGLRRAHREERASEVGRDHGLPVVVRHLVQEVVADDPRARHEDVQPSRLEGRRDRGFDVLAGGDVAADRTASDPLRGLGGRGLVEVRDHDVRALRGEALGRRGADPLRAARDERGLTLEALHRIILETSSATHTGLSPPSRSIVANTTPCSPPGTSSTDWTVKRARMRDPEGTGAGNRTLFTP